MGFDGARCPSMGTRSANTPGDKHKAREFIGRALDAIEDGADIVTLRKRP
jgi:hypothetical protein